MSYSKEEVKEILELEDIYSLLEFFDGEPEIFDNYIISKTICHQGETRKLYYYENTSLFHCFSDSCGTFDIFELVQKVKGINDLNEAIYFIVSFLNLNGKIFETDRDYSLEDWKIFERYSKANDISINKDLIKLKEFDPKIIQHYPQPRILNWEQEDISKEVCDFMNIRYDPIGGNILIPHYDENNRLIGIRQRTLVQEQEKFGKYRPWKTNGKMFNHALGFNLYGLNIAKENIKKMGVAIVFESEKAVLAYLTHFGIANDIAVAVCGSSISKYQFELLRQMGAKEIVIAFDRDFEDIGTDEYHSVVNKLQKIYDKYGSLVNISFLFDKECNQLGYKNSPIDCGKDKFLYLFRNRIIL